MPASRTSPALDALRAEVAQIEAGERVSYPALPFGLPVMDRALPGGGLALGALHEVAGGAAGVVDGAAAALFAAGIVGRLDGWVLWCLTRPDLFAPALAQAGLDPDRVIYVEAGDETSVLACFEEGLRHGALVAVVAEVGITAVPSAELPVPGVGRARWLVELMRVRSGEAADWIMEACDENGHLGVPADLGHGPSVSQAWERRAQA